MTSQGTTQIRATIAANLDRGIDAKGLTNRAVGEAIGRTEHQVWRWRNARHMPNLDNLAALADVLFDGDLTRFYVSLEEEASAA